MILDLEDAVAPEAKVEARAAAIAAIEQGGFGGRLLVVRVNALDSEWGAEDCVALAGTGVSAVLVPKVSTVDQIARYRSAIGEGPELWAMLETCAAFLDLPALAASCPSHGLTTFVLGTNDLALEMRCALDTQRIAMQPLLVQSVVAARAYDLAVLDGVFNDIADEAGFASQCAQGAAMGFDGKTVIHPKQLAVANAAYGPTDDQIARARAVVEAFALPENQGKGVIKVDGRMTEILHLREAERTLAMQAAIAGQALV